MMKNIHVDLGNIDLLIEILRNNIELCLEIDEERLFYFIDMIEKHGRETIFLKIFDVIVSHRQRDIKILQKKVLKVLTMERSSVVNPFNPQTKTKRVKFSDDVDVGNFNYTCLFIKIMSKCLRGDVGINLIAKSFIMLKRKSLLKLMKEQLD